LGGLKLSVVLTLSHTRDPGVERNVGYSGVERNVGYSGVERNVGYSGIGESFGHSGAYNVVMYLFSKEGYSTCAFLPSSRECYHSE